MRDTIYEGLDVTDTLSRLATLYDIPIVVAILQKQYTLRIRVLFYSSLVPRIRFINAWALDPTTYWSELDQSFNTYCTPWPSAPIRL
jgi:hypothetical protein